MTPLRILLAFISISITTPVYAIDSCKAIFAATEVTPLGQFTHHGKDLDAFKKAHSAIVSQNDPSLQNAERACGAVCAINLIQSLSLHTNPAPINSPVNFLNRLSSLYKNGLTQVQLMQFFEHFASFFPEKKLRVHGVLWNNSTHADNNVQELPVISMNELTAKAGSGQALLLAVFHPEKGVLSAHWVALTEIDRANSRVEISDPNFPHTRMTMGVFELTAPDNMKTMLLRPESPAWQKELEQHYGEGVMYFVNAITTIKLEE